VMPDIFSAYVILAVFLLLYSRQTTVHKLLISILLFISLTMHFSNSLILNGMLLVAIITQIKFLRLPEIKRKNFFIVFSTLLLAYLGLKATNYSIDGNSSINRSGHVFVMGKLLDTGMLEQFLCEKCPSNHTLPLCEFRHNLPHNSRELLWKDNGLLFDYGGWIDSKEAFNEVIKEFMLSPKYLAKFTFNVFQSTLTQLFQNDIGSGLISDWYQSPDSPPAYAISTHFPREYTSYSQSRQNGNLWGQRLDFETKNIWNSLLLFISVISTVLFWVWAKEKKQLILQKAFLLTLAIGLVGNAFITAALANIYDRLQARVSWLIVLAFIVCCLPALREIWRYYSEKKCLTKK
jgi:hypothetical protein